MKTLNRKVNTVIMLFFIAKVVEYVIDHFFFGLKGHSKKGRRIREFQQNLDSLWIGIWCPSIRGLARYSCAFSVFSYELYAYIITNHRIVSNDFKYNPIMENHITVEIKWYLNTLKRQITSLKCYIFIANFFTRPPFAHLIFYLK